MFTEKLNTHAKTQTVEKKIPIDNLVAKTSFTTFLRWSKSAQVKIGTGQNRRRKKNELTLLYSA